MIDLHSHFLYGIDDGPKNLKGSLELIKQAVQVGISKLLATPHLTESSSQQDRQRIREVFDEVKEHLVKSRLNLQIQLAAEVYYSPDMIRWAYQSWLFIGSKKSYMLFDIPMQLLPLDLPETIFQLVRRKIIPIMAHPERNRQVQAKPQLLADWIRLGCIMQMDAGSITGAFGRKCQRVATELINQGYIHLVASDAHDCLQRSFHLLAEARTLLAGKYGEEIADCLFAGNPQRILEGDELLRLPAAAAPEGRRNILQKLSVKFKPRS